MPKCELCGGGDSFQMDDLINQIVREMCMVVPGCFCDACFLDYIKSQMEAQEAARERQSTGAALH